MSVGAASAKAVVALLLAALCPGTALAIDIERVVSPAGIEAWLVEDRSVPLVAVSFAFLGGAAEDPAGKAGLANLLSGLLDEGAGELDSRAFQSRLDELSIDLSFDADQDTFGGTLRTLAENRDAAAELLRLALTAPRFDHEPVERVRDQVLARIRAREKNPREIASLKLIEAAFPGHPYGRPVAGTLDSVAAITVEDLRTFRSKLLARDNLKVAVVGAIDGTALGAMLDRVFGALPVKANRAGVPDPAPPQGGRIDVDLAVPQTVIRFAAPGLKRSDPDFIPAYLATFILGGGSGSRLFEEVRESRGLAYSVSLGLDSLDRAGLVSGGTSTRSDQADSVIALIEDEIRRFAADGPSPEELAEAKAYLVGSYPLRFTGSTRIARQLLGIELDGLGIDYIDRRNDLIAAVTIAEVRAAAGRLFGDGGLIVVKVGPPAG